MTEAGRNSSRNIHIAGRGLACALGNTLFESVAGLAAGGVKPAVAEGEMTSPYPYFTIGDTAPVDPAAWTARARNIITNVVREAGGEQLRNAPLFIASSSLNMGAIERDQVRLHDMHAEAEEIACWLDWQGPVYWVSTACTSSINALLSASQMLRDGPFVEAMVLGVELANRYTQSGFAAMQLLSEQAARPLGAGRDGLVLGEAVAALRLSTAPQRWTLCGGACVVDGQDATGASARAVISCWREALRVSGLRADTIDLIKLQAAGSPTNDALELGAVDEVFSLTPALTSLKAHIGHTLGASGAAEIALLTASLEAGVWPTVQHAQDDSLPHCLDAMAPTHSARLLASIIGFGGSHACAVLQDNGIEPHEPEADVVHRFRLWEVCGRSGPALPDGWREALATLLGQRPRRIGTWAEAGLFGALSCMRDADETALPAGAILRLSSLGGPIAATLQTLQTIKEDGMAMPFAFLQSQPGQLLAIIAQAVQWQGDARIMNSRDPLALLHAACNEAGPRGVLIGWLEEAHDAATASNFWLRLRPADPHVSADFAPATLAGLQVCRYVRLGLEGKLDVA
ncbi:MAG: Beta-ketoacyl synthase [Rhodocyclales bacterium]|nr:Beta-ketoacyl synthase [Rhodocyclales bacterium]